MTEDELTLVSSIQAAFKDRPIPNGRIIDVDVDLEIQIEARRVDAYIRTNMGVVDRHNSVLCAFNYLSPDAALSMIPHYMISIIYEFDEEDYIIDVVLTFLSGGFQGKKSRVNRNLVKMRKLATPDEARAVCCFCRWLLSKTSGPDSDIIGPLVIGIWCE